jgi:nucleotide-binding universal stress UspA family protein
MKKSNIWVVPIDFSPIDVEVIEYTKFLVTFQKPEKVYFLNIVQEFKQSFIQEFESFQKQIIIDQKHQLEHRVDMHFKKANIPYECCIESGTPFQGIIDFVLSKSASLVILGKKIRSSGSGVVSDNLARSLPCNILLVTEGFEPKLNNVLVTTDFSEHADLAMNVVLELLTDKKHVNLFAIHGYEVPLGFYKSGKTHKEFAAIMKSHAEKEMLIWCRKSDYDISPIYVLCGESSFAEQVIRELGKQKIDLVVMGSKGQSAASLALLGSNTMKVLKANTEVPMLIVKKSGENMSFIDALKKMR